MVVVVQSGTRRSSHGGMRRSSGKKAGARGDSADDLSTSGSAPGRLGPPPGPLPSLVRSLPCYLAFGLVVIVAAPSIGLAAIALGLASIYVLAEPTKPS